MARPEAGGRCADFSEAAGESLAATAVTARAWLLVEVPGAWPRDVSAPRHAAPRPQSRRSARGSPRRRGSRLQFVRRPGRRRRNAARVRRQLRGSASLRCTASSSTISTRSRRRPRRVEASPSTDRSCSCVRHGSRDQCCSLRGTAVFGALAGRLGEEELWISSHLGGHRFAANVVVLPAGLQFGRVTPDRGAVRRRAGARRQDRARALSRSHRVRRGGAGGRARRSRRRRARRRRRPGAARAGERPGPVRDAGRTRVGGGGERGGEPSRARELRRRACAPAGVRVARIVESSRVGASPQRRRRYARSVIQTTLSSRTSRVEPIAMSVPKTTRTQLPATSEPGAEITPCQVPFDSRIFGQLRLVAGRGAERGQRALGVPRCSSSVLPPVSKSMRPKRPVERGARVADRVRDGRVVRHAHPRLPSVPEHPEALDLEDELLSRRAERLPPPEHRALRARRRRSAPPVPRRRRARPRARRRRSRRGRRPGPQSECRAAAHRENARTRGCGTARSAPEASSTLARALDLYEYQGKELFARVRDPRVRGAARHDPGRGARGRRGARRPGRRQGAGPHGRARKGRRDQARRARPTRPRRMRDDDPRPGHPRPRRPQGLDRAGVGHRARVLPLDHVRPRREEAALHVHDRGRRGHRGGRRDEAGGARPAPRRPARGLPAVAGAPARLRRRASRIPRSRSRSPRSSGSSTRRSSAARRCCARSTR